MGVGDLLEAVDLIVIGRSAAPKIWGARIDWGWSRTSKEDGIVRG